MDEDISASKRLEAMQRANVQRGKAPWALPSIRLTAKQARTVLDNEMARRMKTVAEERWQELYKYLSREFEQAHVDVDLWYDHRVRPLTPEILENVMKEIGGRGRRRKR